MQVAASQLDGFFNRVRKEYMESESYLALRKNRQRTASLAVIDFLLKRGGQKVRRRDIRRLFIAKGVEHSKTSHDEAGDDVILSELQLQRILKRLVHAGFIERSEEYAESKRTKGKKKEVYYAISRSHIKQEDCMTVAGPLLKGHKIKEGLLEMDLKSINDEDFWEWLNGVARFVFELEPNDWRIRQWAMKLPPSKRLLRTQVLRHLDESGHYYPSSPPGN